MRSQWYAHTANRLGRSEPVITHLRRVAELAELYTSAWDSAWEGRAAGLLHDLGKYGELFQERLEGRAKRIDHSTPGARAAAERYRGSGLALALAVQGHHGGLRSASPSELSRALKMEQERSAQGRRYAERNVAALLDRFHADGGVLPPVGESLMRRSVEAGLWDAALLDARMLFSALVDADSRATAAHTEEGPEGYRIDAHSPPLEPARALQLVQNHIAAKRSSSTSSTAVQSLRDDLLAACLEAAAAPPGLFTLTAPTGAGKTLAMLAFALRHAALHGLRRIVLVLPYLTIIDQTAGIYREIFAPFGPDYVLEEHSLAGDPQPDRKPEEVADDHDTASEPLRRFVQSWDEPVILTTTVRFFESLFSNRRSNCHKLHNLARSIILFDEAQTMPVALAVPTLAALAHLRTAYGSTVLFSTATQPALHSLFATAEAKRPRSFGGWRPTEIAGPELRLFERARRVDIFWPASPQAEMPWEELAARLVDTPQALAIVNLRRHAVTLFRLVKERAPDGLFHLSTNMCPEHRRTTLDNARAALKEKQPCRMVSTQCVEAGVDIDFPAVWRALAPLDSIAQAAGRCNREGKRPKGRVTVFHPPQEQWLYPPGYYERAAIRLKTMLTDNPALDILEPATVEHYFRSYYATHTEQDEELEQAIQAKDLERTAHCYRWIEGEGLNLLVPYTERIEEFWRLAAEARAGRFSAAWLRAARALSVNVRLKRRIPILDQCEEVRHKEESTGWYILNNDTYYDPALGLIDDGDPDANMIA